MSKVILITGTSSGVGLQSAIQLAQQGHTVYATMRNPDKKGAIETIAREKNVSIRILRLDVQDENEIQQCVDTIISESKQIDVLINNAGAGFIRTLEQAGMGEIQQVMDVNFYGAVRCMKAVLPHMRERHMGHIVNISSVGGLVGQPMNELYCAAKFALEGLCESMATYLFPYFGINISIIEPGGIITEFGNNIMDHFVKTGGILKDDYEPLVNDYMNYRKTFTDEVREKVFQSADQVAQVIVECIADPHPRLRYLTSASAKEFTRLKSGLDETGEKLQATIRRNILNK